MSVDTAEPTPNVTGPDLAEPEGSGVPGRASVLRRVAPWVIAVLALAAALYSTAQLRPYQQAAADGALVTDVSRDVLSGMTNWDATRDLGTTREALRALGTGSFPADVDGFLGGDIAESLRSIEARSEGTIEDIFVQSLVGDEAIVFAVVRQVLDTSLLVAPSEGFQYARVFLRRVDGVWLVASVELLGGDEPPIDPVPTVPTSEEDAG